MVKFGPFDFSFILSFSLLFLSLSFFLFSSSAAFLFFLSSYKRSKTIRNELNSNFVDVHCMRPSGFRQKDILIFHLTLSQMTKFRLLQTERLCRRQFQIWWKWLKVLQTSIKHCGKRRNCSLRAISPFPTVFPKDYYCRRVKFRACFGKGNKPM